MEGRRNKTRRTCTGRDRNTDELNDETADEEPLKRSESIRDQPGEIKDGKRTRKRGREKQVEENETNLARFPGENHHDSSSDGGSIWVDYRGSNQ